MNIEIKERIITITNKSEFKELIENYCKRYKKIYPSTIGLSSNSFIKEFNLKLRILEFYELCEECKIKRTYNGYVSLDF